MKTLILIGLLFALVFQGGPPCATVVATLGSASLQQGQTQTIESLVTNCGGSKEKFRVTVTATDSTGVTDLLRNTQHMLNANQSITLNDSYEVATDAPLGTYRIITIVFHVAGGSTTEIARDTKEFQVTN